MGGVGLKMRGSESVCMLWRVPLSECITWYPLLSEPTPGDKNAPPKNRRGDGDWAPVGIDALV